MIRFRHRGEGKSANASSLIGTCSITAAARAEVKTGTAVYGAHVGGCAHVWTARARTVA